MRIDITYHKPTLEDYDILMEYIKEHYDNGETHISASFGLTSTDYKEWIRKVESASNVPTEGWGRSNLYLVCCNDHLIGLLNVRYEMSDEFQRTYGNIGYGVRPSARGLGFATEMLRYALKKCESHGMKYAIVGCIEDNVASQKVMVKNGGQLIHRGPGYKKDAVNLYYKFTLQKPKPEPELWDLYTRDKKVSGKFHTRGVWPIPDGYYHMVMHAWIRNSKGEYLISQRAATRPSHPLEWECVGGSVIKGETSLESAIREIKEEVGLDLLPSDGELVFTKIRDRIGNLECRDIMEVYLFHYDGDVDLEKSTTDEVTQVRWMTVDEIKELFNRKEMVYTLDYFFTDIVNH